MLHRTQFHTDRLEAILRELWAANSLDLHMCDGSRREGRRGLLSNIREDVRVLLSSNTALLRALRGMVYETTHLSPQEDDGSHWCKISRGALAEGRAALLCADVDNRTLCVENDTERSHSVEATERSSASNQREWDR